MYTSACACGRIRAHTLIAKTYINSVLWTCIRRPWHIQSVFEFLCLRLRRELMKKKRTTFLFYNIVQLWAFLLSAGSGEAAAAAATKDKQEKKEKENIPLFPRPTYHDADL